MKNFCSSWITHEILANKQQIIELMMDQMSSLPIPEGKHVILTGQEPCPLEAVVLVPHYMVKEAT